MDIRAHVAMWSALAFMGCAAPIVWLYSLQTDWTRGDILALLQTVFSVGAIVLALSIAILEMRRSRASELKRRSQLIEVARSLLSQIIDDLTLLSEGKPTAYTALQGDPAKDFRNGVIGMRNQLTMSADVFEALSAQVLETRLAFALVNAKHLCKIATRADSLGSPGIEDLQQLEKVGAPLFGSFRRAMTNLRDIVV